MGSWSQREGCGCAGDSHSTAPPPRRSPRLFLPLLPPVILPRLTVHSASISMVTVLRTMSSLPLLPFLALWPSTSTVTVLPIMLSLPLRMAKRPIAVDVNGDGVADYVVAAP